MPIKYDPRERKYYVEHEHLTPELGKRIVEDSLKLVRALGYDMNSLEWAIRDGIPYAIDFMNPAPDMDIYSLTPFYFEWVVKHMADMAIRLAKNRAPKHRNLRWDTFLDATSRDQVGNDEVKPSWRDASSCTLPLGQEPGRMAMDSEGRRH